MNEAERSRSGAVPASILLLTLGEQEAAQVLALTGAGTINAGGKSGRHV
jgi:hypothetical protein